MDSGSRKLCAAAALIFGANLFGLWAWHQSSRLSSCVQDKFRLQTALSEALQAVRPVPPVEPVTLCHAYRRYVRVLEDAELTVLRCEPTNETTRAKWLFWSSEAASYKQLIAERCS